MKLSNQALSCVMVALQKSLMEQTDIVPLLRSFEMVLDGEELVVSNPPTTLLATPIEKK
jgi:hypothetical protein